MKSDKLAHSDRKGSTRNHIHIIYPNFGKQNRTEILIPRPFSFQHYTLTTKLRCWLKSFAIIFYTPNKGLLQTSYIQTSRLRNTHTTKNKSSFKNPPKAYNKLHVWGNL